MICPKCGKPLRVDMFAYFDYNTPTESCWSCGIIRNRGSKIWHTRKTPDLKNLMLEEAKEMEKAIA